jgi:putative redox protein
MIETCATWTDEHRFVGATPSGHRIVIDGDRQTGPSPIELVLLALCGCTGYDVIEILRKKREPLTSLEVTARAERADRTPSVFTHIHLTYHFGGSLSHKAVEDAVRLSEEKYCSIAAMLGNSAKITYHIHHKKE